MFYYDTSFFFRYFLRRRPSYCFTAPPFGLHSIFHFFEPLHLPATSFHPVPVPIVPIWKKVLLFLGLLGFFFVVPVWIGGLSQRLKANNVSAVLLHLFLMRVLWWPLLYAVWRVSKEERSPLSSMWAGHQSNAPWSFFSPVARSSTTSTFPRSTDIRAVLNSVEIYCILRGILWSDDIDAWLVKFKSLHSLLAK